MTNEDLEALAERVQYAIELLEYGDVRLAMNELVVAEHILLKQKGIYGNNE